MCVDKPIGYECRCNTGFKPNPKDPHLCSDIDECSEHPKPCSQICRNTFGSYNCSCTDGYIPIHNGHSCKTNSSKHLINFFNLGKEHSFSSICFNLTGLAPTLLFSNRYYIREVSLHSRVASVRAHNLTNAVALDYDWFEQW